MKIDVRLDREADSVRTRDAVVTSLLEHGPQTAASLGTRLSLSPAAIRRHLDSLLADNRVATREHQPPGPRGRGRPAKTFALTDAGREGFPHAYDDLAAAALRFLHSTGGEAAVRAFAVHRASGMVAATGPGADGLDAVPATAGALAAALNAQGYAATVQPVSSGDQICQHHCPVAHVAAEFPQLCEAETEVFAQRLGTHVQRLATIAHGDGVCTTHVPAHASRRTRAASATGSSTRSDTRTVTSAKESE